MKFSYNWLKEYISFKESPEKLADLLTLRSFEIESAEKSGNDWRLNIALLPNRIPDASGHIGLAREIAAVTGSKLKSEALNAKKYSTGLIRQFLDIKVENSEDCPRYMALMIDGVKVKESPPWLKQRLELCGLKSINNLVDAANYVMLETGQPLHIFDYKKLKAKREKRKDVVVRRARKNEKIVGLDEKEYLLNPEILVIADSEKPIAIAGIKGGKDSGVTAETKTIVLEAANFNQAVIRRVSKLLNLKTDASFRFEHGLDPNLTDFSIRRLADLISRLAGGNVKGMIDVYPKKIVPLKLLLRLEYANRLIGIQIPFQFYKNAFLSLGMKVEEKNKMELIVEIPTVRRDILIEVDLVEEISRLYGYEKISASLWETAHSQPEENDELFWENKIRDILVSQGFNESFIYEFTGEQELAVFEESFADYCELENPMSPETRYLVKRPLLKYIKQVAENSRNFDSVKIFGVAKAFRQGPAFNASRPDLNSEQKHLIIALSEKAIHEDEAFYELKGSVDSLLESLGISEYSYSEVASSDYMARLRFFHPFRIAEIKASNEILGIIGELHPEATKKLKSKVRIVAAEIEFDNLWKKSEVEAEYRPISKYPVIIRDIAVLVPFNEKTETILNVIENAGGEVLADTGLFDYFYDENMKNKSQKSLAFHLKFESRNRTLRDEEIDKIMQKIVEAIGKKGWIVRE